MTYLDHMQSDGVGGTVCVHSWWVFTARRLNEVHGPDRAAEITAGRDPQTQSDISAWNALGKREAN